MTPRGVLFVASECAPLVKTGGLADVVGALPGALAPLGWRARVLLPAYPGLAARLEGAQDVAHFGDLYGGWARIIAGRVGALDLLLLEAEHLFHRPGGPYLGPDGKDWPDNPQRFAALSAAAAHVARGGLSDGWRPAVAHLHDWQAGLTGAMLADDPARPAIVTTIHNIAFQGLAPAHLLGSLGLPPHQFTADGLEYWGQISALKAGLVYADAITTVSPTYAEELKTPQFGLGLEGVIRARAADLSGIVNGVDLEDWNPETDPHIPAHFSAKAMKGKAACRAALLSEFGLPDAADGPVLGVVSRLTGQKGLDLLLAALPDALEMGMRLVLLGSGEPALEAAFAAAAAKAPDRVGVRIGYDEGLSRRIMAGSDAILVPSRFEPCGLTQLYGLRYGAIPLVARTGGLADTVIDANTAALAAGVATGVQFAPVTTEALRGALARLNALYRAPKTWTAMMRAAMKQPVGWGPSAATYAALYDRIARE